MPNYPIQEIFQSSYEEYCSLNYYQSNVQYSAAHSIMNCKSGALGVNISSCQDCGHTEIHNNSCRNRNCPNCQAVKKEIWVDKRRSEVIDSPYFHVVFTTPHELNDLLYCNQKLLYTLFHKCCAETLLELSSNKKYLGAQPGIIQVLHTWNQELSYHVHMHCIISGGGLTESKKIRKSSQKFFIPVYVLRDKFQGKFLAMLQALYQENKLVFSTACKHLVTLDEWKHFRNALYEKEWCPYIKETFNGFGNAIEYLGKYTHKIAISNNRIHSLSETEVTFSARGFKTGDARRFITLSKIEFIRRYLMHVLPSGFQKIRYYGFLNNRCKAKNLNLIFKLQGYQRFKMRYENLSVCEIIKLVWKIDLTLCPVCGCNHMRSCGRTYGST